MHKENLELGLCPADETCPQVGCDGYTSDAYTVGALYIDQLYGRFPWAEAAGLKFRLRTFGHDFGMYNEAVVIFDDLDEYQTQLAYFIEENLPLTWNDKKVFTKPDQVDADATSAAFDEMFDCVMDQVKKL
jgi:hypothetical protein